MKDSDHDDDDGDGGDQERVAEEEQNQSQDDDEDDDTLMACRCEKPKLLVDLLQSFSKHGGWSRNSSSSVGSGNKSGGGGGSGTTQSSQRLVDGVSTNKLHPMTIFCTRNGLTIHSQSSNKQFQAVRSTCIVI